jgi:ribosomal protein S18 acetylase RimI-like enzyme
MVCRCIYKTMSEDDIDVVCGIIKSSSVIDSVISKTYYTEYFKNQYRVDIPDEENYVVLVDGKIVGVCGFKLDQYETPYVRWINWFYVDPEYQGRGIGRSLLSFCLDKIKSMGVKRVYLDTDTNEVYSNAISLYLSMGFTKQGNLENYYSDEDLIIMGKEL